MASDPPEEGDIEISKTGINISWHRGGARGVALVLVMTSLFLICAGYLIKVILNATGPEHTPQSAIRDAQ